MEDFLCRWILAVCRGLMPPAQQGPCAGIRFHMETAQSQGYQVLPTQSKYKYGTLYSYSSSFTVMKIHNMSQLIISTRRQSMWLSHDESFATVEAGEESRTQKLNVMKKLVDVTVPDSMVG